MKKYSINYFFSDEECKNYLTKLIEIGIPFKYNPNELWDCRRINDETFKIEVYNFILEKYKNNSFDFNSNFNIFNVKSINVSLTSYYEGRYLNLHKDASSSLTFVIVLSDNFNDGRFTITESVNNNADFQNTENMDIIDIPKGYGIVFDGSKLYHGVLPVNSGIRYALNIWLSEESNQFAKLKTDNSII